MKRDAKVQFAVFFAITVIAVLPRFYDLGAYGLWIDEYTSLRDSATWQSAVKSFHAPLYFLMLHVWSWFGEDPIWYRSLSACIGVATVWLVYFLANDFSKNRLIAAGAAILYAAAPMAIWFSREVRMYNLFTFFVVAIFLCLLRYLANPGQKKWLIAYWIASVGAVASHYYAAFFVGAFMISGLVIASRASGAQIIRPLRAVFLMHLPFVCGLFFAVILIYFRFSQYTDGISAFLSYVWQGPPVYPWTKLYELLYFENWAFRRPYFLFGYTMPYYASAAVILFCLVLLFFDKRLGQRHCIAFAIATVVPFLIINFTGIRSTLRLSMPALPFFAILVSYGTMRSVQISLRKAKENYYYPSVIFSAAVLAWIMTLSDKVSLVYRSEIHPWRVVCEDIEKAAADLSDQKMAILMSAAFHAPIFRYSCRTELPLFPYAIVNGDGIVRPRLERNFEEEIAPTLTNYDRVLVILAHNWKGDPGFHAFRAMKDDFTLSRRRAYGPLIQMYTFDRNKKVAARAKSP